MLLKGKKIFLRPVSFYDAKILYAWENDKTIWKFGNTSRTYTKKEIEHFIAESQKDIYSTKQMRWIICCVSPKVSLTSIRKNKNEVGCIDLFDFDPHHRKAGVGILIANKKNRRKGYASESLQLLIKHSFNKLHLHQLYCNITKNNAPSLRLFEIHKFKIAGKKKDWVILGNRFTDEFFLQLINKQ